MTAEITEPRPENKEPGLPLYERTHRAPFMSHCLDTRFAGVHAVWTLTTGKSGTVKLADALRVSPGLEVVHEPHPYLFQEQRLAMEGRPLKTAAAIRLLNVARGWALYFARKDRRVYVECSMWLTYLARHLRQAFVSSRFIHLVRDPREFVRSALAASWYYRDNDRAFWFPLGALEAEPPWVRLIWFWVEIHAEALKLEREWGPEIVHRIRAEDMWSDMDYLIELVCWIGAERVNADRFRTAYAHNLHQVVNAATRAKPTWTPEMEGVLQVMAGTLLEEFGYREAPWDLTSPPSSAPLASACSSG